jgi:hypothetical protein
MTDDTGRTNVVREGQFGWISLAIALVTILAFAGLGVGWRGLSDAQDNRQALNADIEKVNEGTARYATDMQLFQARVAQDERTNADLQASLGVLTKRIRFTQRQLQKARQEAQGDLQQVRDESSRRIAAIGSQIDGQLATKASNDDLQAVSGQVAVVRTGLESTNNDLQEARHEIGTLFIGGHYAVEMLLRMGERDSTEFTIAERNKPQTVGGVTIELKKTNPKKNQFNLVLVVDDKRTEMRNRTVDEPIFIYTHHSQQPLEIVIDQVEKNKVTGYVSVPKVAQQASASNTVN